MSNTNKGIITGNRTLHIFIILLLLAAPVVDQISSLLCEEFVKQKLE